MNVYNQISVLKIFENEEKMAYLVMLVPVSEVFTMASVKLSGELMQEIHQI